MPEEPDISITIASDACTVTATLPRRRADASRRTRRCCGGEQSVNSVLPGSFIIIILNRRLHLRPGGSTVSAGALTSLLRAHLSCMCAPCPPSSPPCTLTNCISVCFVLVPYRRSVAPCSLAGAGDGAAVTAAAVTAAAVAAAVSVAAAAIAAVAAAVASAAAAIAWTEGVMRAAVHVRARALAAVRARARAAVRAVCVCAAECMRCCAYVLGVPL